MPKNKTKIINGLDLTSYIESNNLSWSDIVRYVKTLQKGIYEASCIGNSLKVRSEQDKLIMAKKTSLLALRQILHKKVDSSFNSRESVNEFLLINDDYDSFKIYLEQLVNINNKEIIDIVIQQILLMALKPEWEARVELNSYGFSSSQGVNQAVIKTYGILSENTNYENSTVLVGHVNHWFHNVDISLILKKSNLCHKINRYFVSLRERSLFRRSSMLLGKNFQSLELQSFSYNSIAMLLANKLFYGLEAAVLWQSQSLKNNDSGADVMQISMVVYSDHFLVIFPNKNLKYIVSITHTIKLFFNSMGLDLQNSSLCVRSIHEGFDFLGFNFKRYANANSWNNQDTKLIIRPTQGNIKKHLLSMRYCLYHKDRLNRWRANSQMTQYDVISRLNPLIRDFSHYYYDLTPPSTLKMLDRTVNEIVYRYAIKKYKSNRLQKWNDNWTIVIGGKKIIACKDGNGTLYQALYLHHQYNLL